MVKRRGRFLRYMLRVAIFFVVLIGCLYAGKDYFARRLFEGGFSALTGLDCSVQSVRVGIFRPTFHIRRCIVSNPALFSDRTMFVIERMYVAYDPVALYHRTLRIRDMALEVGSFFFLRNKEGFVNLDAFRTSPAVQRTFSKDNIRAVRIDNLRLKGAQVTHKDYTKDPYPRIVEYDVRMDARYRDIEDFGDFAKTVVSEALANARVTGSTGSAFDDLQARIADAAQKGATAVTQATVATFERSKQIAQDALRALTKTNEGG